jgi:hypothetical protein
MTSCSTACGDVCTAQENLKCSVSCQVKNSAMCTYTTPKCQAGCSSGGAVIVCNGKVVEVATTVAEAQMWFLATLDADFKFMVSASCNGTGTCTATACDASPKTTATDGTGLLLAGLAFAGVGIARRRRERNG